ncbi:MAG: hypothetical protein ACRDIY_18850 [Chloroflexota bacterium]
MKRVTVLFDDERLYQDVKAEAAKEGRPVKDVVAEALGSWLAGRTRLNEQDRQRRSATLRELDELRSSLPRTATVEDDLAGLRAERS